MRWCLSTARPCSGGTGQGRLPTHWSVPALHRLTALCDPWLSHEAQRGRVAHLRPHKSWVAGLGVCRQASLMLGLGLFQTITLLLGSQRPRTACRSHQPSPGQCLALSRCSTDIWGLPGGGKHSACSKLVGKYVRGVDTMAPRRPLVGRSPCPSRLPSYPTKQLGSSPSPSPAESDSASSPTIPPRPPWWGRAVHSSDSRQMGGPGSRRQREGLGEAHECPLWGSLSLRREAQTMDSPGRVAAPPSGPLCSSQPCLFFHEALHPFPAQNRAPCPSPPLTHPLCTVPLGASHPKRIAPASYVCVCACMHVWPGEVFCP